MVAHWEDMGESQESQHNFRTATHSNTRHRPTAQKGDPEVNEFPGILLQKWLLHRAAYCTDFFLPNLTVPPEPLLGLLYTGMNTQQFRVLLAV